MSYIKIQVNKICTTYFKTDEPKELLFGEALYWSYHPICILGLLFLFFGGGREGCGGGGNSSSIHIQIIICCSTTSDKSKRNALLTKNVSLFWHRNLLKMCIMLLFLLFNASNILTIYCVGKLFFFIFRSNLQYHFCRNIVKVHI